MMENEEPVTVTNAPDASDEEKESNAVCETGADVPDPELIMKHPLHNSWSLWFFKNDKAKSWTENLNMVAKFQNVEDFWGLYNHIQPASRLQHGCDYSVFKDGIKPMWEDPKNKKGGRWLLNLEKRQRRNDLDQYWLETLLCLVGEAFGDNSDNICGAVVNVRNRGDKLALWTGDGRNNAANLKIGEKLKQRLNVSHKISIGYELHDDTASKSSSTTKHSLVL